MVSLYNREYVCRPLERLGSPEWQSRLSARDLSEIESSRERWTHFIEELERFLKELKEEFGKDTLHPYFERPKKL